MYRTKTKSMNIKVQDFFMEKQCEIMTWKLYVVGCKLVTTWYNIGNIMDMLVRKPTENVA